VAQAKISHYDDLYDKLDMQEGTKKIYRLAATRHKATQDIGQVKNIRAKDGRLLRDPRENLNRWYEYFRDMSNIEFPHPPIISAKPTEGPVASIASSEVSEALRKMKNAKAPDPDEVPAEAWKLLSDRGIELLTTMFNKITTVEKVPPIWSTSVTVPIWKNKGEIGPRLQFSLWCFGLNKHIYKLFTFYSFYRYP